MNASSSVVPSRAPYVRRFLLDYARNPVNLMMLILVPVIFVLVAAGPMADAAELLGGPGGPAVEAATAGWAAGFIAAIAMYFQMGKARAADHDRTSGNQACGRADGHRAGPRDAAATRKAEPLTSQSVIPRDVMMGGVLALTR